MDSNILFLSRTHQASTSVAARMVSAMYRQSLYNPTCGEGFSTSSLDGQLILLTGGNNGIGIETAKGLVLRGADVIIASRNQAKNEEVAIAIRAQAAVFQRSGSVHTLILDLSNLDTVVEATRSISKQFPGRKLNQLILNAGHWPTSGYSASAQGYEMAFATNTLGHFLLLRRLIDAQQMHESARVIFVTGDIYIMASDCTPNFTYTSSITGGQMAYCRSKLGLNWIFFQCRERYPSLWLSLVHPGVIASDLVGSSTGLTGFFKKSLLLDCYQGAQTTLICATTVIMDDPTVAPVEVDSFSRPALIEEVRLRNGAYYHNTCGRMLLQPDDPACNCERAVALWEEMEKICEPFLDNYEIGQVMLS